MDKPLFGLTIVAAAMMISCRTAQRAALVHRLWPVHAYMREGKMFTAMFQQTAAEYRALCYQSYNSARVRAENYVPTTAKPLAVITDIDETLLDNSPFAVHQALREKDFDIGDWYAWTSRAEADTLPGAADLLKFLHAKNISVFYVTNRDSVERAATLRNLQRFNLPDADETHLVTRQGSSSKESRRQKIMQDYEVVFLMGDNLADLSSLWDKKTGAERANGADSNRKNFGNRFIVLPNPGYGDWEASFLNYNYALTDAQKDSILVKTLKTY